MQLATIIGKTDLIVNCKLDFLKFQVKLAIIRHQGIS